MTGLFMLLWTLTMLLGGVTLLAVGLVRLIRKGPVPRLSRSEPIACLLMGALFIAAPGIYSVATQPAHRTINMGTSTQF